MKRYNNLFNKIVSLDNLYLADKKARRNKSNRKDIKEFDQNKEESLKKLQQDLINGTYKTSEYNTFISCIKHRGIHEALHNVKEALKDVDNTTYCLKLDIRKFYPSINHEVLKSIIRKKIKDQKLLQLLDEIIDSAEGVPIGNYLSQFFANLYLTYFDHWLKEDKQVKIKSYQFMQEDFQNRNFK